MGLIGFVLGPLFHQVPITFIPPLSFAKNATIWLETIHKARGTISFAPNFAYALAARRAKPQQMSRWDLSCMYWLKTSDVVAYYRARTNLG